MNWSAVTSRSLRLLSAVATPLVRALAPASCVFCGSQEQLREPAICRGCYADLPWVRRACSGCAAPLPTELPAGVHCAACQAKPTPFAAAAAPFHYRFPVDAAIKAMKFRRRLHYVPAFADALEKSMQRIPADVDALLPVPLHWRRRALRGFNQATELARALRQRTCLPLIRNVIRCRATPSQSNLAAEQRRHNLQSAFAVRGTIAARHVLIVDDVITTGETCRALAAVLLEAGAVRVSVLAVARA